jgi:hypothetical protein
MNLELFDILGGLCGIIVGWGLFLQTASVVRQKKSVAGLMFKLAGIVGLCWRLFERESNPFVLIGLFFATLIGSLFVFTLARHRLLR